MTAEPRASDRIANVTTTDHTLSAYLADGRVITVPLAFYPRLLQATAAQRAAWKIAGGGYGIRWEEIDEDLSVEGLLRGAPAPASTRRGAA